MSNDLTLSMRHVHSTADGPEPSGLRSDELKSVINGALNERSCCGSKLGLSDEVVACLDSEPRKVADDDGAVEPGREVCGSRSSEILECAVDVSEHMSHLAERTTTVTHRRDATALPDDQICIRLEQMQGGLGEPW